MTKSLTEFIRERRPEIVAQIQELQRELKQLDAYGLAPDKSDSGRTPTIKEMVVTVLDGYGSGLRANEILSLIEERYGVTLARESLSPQLTRLSKEDNKVKLVGRKWSLI